MQIDRMSGSMLHKIRALLATPEPPGLGPGPRAGVSTEAQLNETLTQAFDGTTLPAENQELARALVLLWHDHLHAAHRLVQDRENLNGFLVHGLVHRRENDYSNARFWLRSVDQHASFAEVSRRVTVYLDSKNEPELRDQLLPKGAWNLMAFVDALEAAAKNKAPAPRQVVLREIQRIELEKLLEHFLKPKPAPAK